MITNGPKVNIGDTIYWYCSEDGRVRHAKVQFVNFAKVGDNYIEINYEVEIQFNGKKRTLFIDDCDAMECDLSA